MIYLILLFTILFFILAWRRFDFAVMFLIAALPTYLIRFNIFGLPSTILEVMIWIVFSAWFFKNYRYIFENCKLKIGHLLKIENCLSCLAQGKLKIIGRYPFDWEMVLLLLVALLAVAVAGFNLSAFGIWKAYFFEPILFFIVILNVMKGEKGRKKILWSLAVSALIVSVLAIYQKITGAFIDNPVWAAEETRRVVSFFGYPNAVGLYLGPLVLVMAGWLATVIARNFILLSSSGGRQRNPGIHAGEARNNLDSRLRGNDKVEMVARNDIVVVFISLTIILSILSIYFAKSKGALLGMAAGLIVFGLMVNKKIKWVTIIFLVVVSFGIVIYQPTRNLALENINFINLSGQIRRAGWSDAWRMLRGGRLITGAGLANFQVMVAPYHTEGIFFKDPSDPEAQRKLVFNESYRTAHWQPLEIYLYPHNLVLNFWSELGLAGLLLFIWIIGKYLWLGVKNLPTQKNRFIVIGLISAMMAIVIHGLVDVPYFKNDLAVIFWLLMAIMSLINLENKYEKNL